MDGNTALTRSELASFRDLLTRMLDRVNSALGEAPVVTDEVSRKRAAKALRAMGLR